MLDKINIIQYRKLHNISIEFSPTVNIISGTNGTCKTSLLHIISNSYQAVTKMCNWLHDTSCLDVIKQINNIMNPKIESLTKGDKAYNDPANGIKGPLFSVDYHGQPSLEFRKHNSRIMNRYAVKPKYPAGIVQKLPYCPVIYLGLTRLFPFGEFQNDEAVKRINKRLPQEYQQEAKRLYQELTGININMLSVQKMGDVKKRADFTSDKDGIDSNTISAGEDNLFIILCALVSLKYYYESIESSNDIESVLLIDEFDATLHPSLQFKLLNIFRDYAVKYKIQMVFTSHSLSAIEYAMDKKDNVIYLVDNVTSVVKMADPDIYKIKAHLYGLTHDDIYLSKKIPIFTEDNEARIFLNLAFDYIEEKHHEFSGIRSKFHLVEANIGADNLKAIFSDTYLLKSTMKYLCILDGDQSEDLTNHRIKLPGGDSPEKMIMVYAQQLYDNDSPFWTQQTIIDTNLGKVYYRDNIKPDIDNITTTLEELRRDGKSTHGVERKLRKEVFLKHQRFFELLFIYWLNDDEHADNVGHFYKNLNILFKKVASFYSINPAIWTV